MPKICTARLVTAACGLVLAAAAHADVSTKDREFLTQAATGGLYEVQAGKLAQNRATANEVKSFGAMLVKDHTAANDELRALAARKGVALPTTLPGDKQKQLDQLAKAQKFDQEFLSQVGLNRPLKKCFSNASGTLSAKTRAAQTRLRSDCNGPSGRFAGPPAHFGRTYPWAHA